MSDERSVATIRGTVVDIGSGHVGVLLDPDSPTCRVGDRVVIRLSDWPEMAREQAITERIASCGDNGSETR